MPASAVVKPTTVVLPPMPAPTAAGAAKKAKTAPAGEVDQEENPRGAYRFAQERLALLNNPSPKAAGSVAEAAAKLGKLQAKLPSTVDPAQLADLQGQVAAVQSELAERQAEVPARQQTIADLQATVDEINRLEALSAFRREFPLLGPPREDGVVETMSDEMAFVAYTEFMRLYNAERDGWLAANALGATIKRDGTGESEVWMLARGNQWLADYRARKTKTKSRGQQWSDFDTFKGTDEVQLFIKTELYKILAEQLVRLKLRTGTLSTQIRDNAADVITKRKEAAEIPAEATGAMKAKKTRLEKAAIALETANEEATKESNYIQGGPNGPDPSNPTLLEQVEAQMALLGPDVKAVVDAEEAAKQSVLDSAEATRAKAAMRPMFNTAFAGISPPPTDDHFEWWYKRQLAVTKEHDEYIANYAGTTETPQNYTEEQWNTIFNYGGAAKKPAAAAAEGAATATPPKEDKYSVKWLTDPKWSKKFSTDGKTFYEVLEYCENLHVERGFAGQPLVDQSWTTDAEQSWLLTHGYVRGPTTFSKAGKVDFMSIEDEFRKVASTFDLKSSDVFSDRFEEVFTQNRGYFLQEEKNKISGDALQKSMKESIDIKGVRLVYAMEEVYFKSKDGREPNELEAPWDELTEPEFQKQLKAWKKLREGTDDVIKEIRGRKLRFETWFHQLKSRADKLVAEIKQINKDNKEKRERDQKQSKEDHAEKMANIKADQDKGADRLADRLAEKSELEGRAKGLGDEIEAKKAAGAPVGLVKELEGKLRKLKEQIRQRSVQARKQEGKNRAKEREKQFQLKLQELEKDASTMATRIAAAFIVLQERQDTVQAEFDQEQTASGGYDPTSEPEQPGLDTDDSEGVRRTATPFVELPFTDEQHLNFFLHEDEAFPELDTSESGSQSGESAPDPMMGSTAGMAGVGLVHVEGDGSGAEMAADTGVLAGELLREEEVYNGAVVIKNRVYMRRMLAAHLMEHKRLWHLQMTESEGNKKVQFVNISDALGNIGDWSGPVGGPLTFTNTPSAKDPETGEDIPGTTGLEMAVEGLLASFEQMVAYRNTMLRVKELQIEQDLELFEELDGSGDAGNPGVAKSVRAGRLQIRLNEVRKHAQKAGLWDVEAQKLMQLHDGRLPGQLYSPQPYFLPLRVSAPPRVGKSATALLMASLAKRVGMTCFYSVSPNKKTPIQEMSTKLVRLGWRDRDLLRNAGGSAGSVAEQRCVRMHYRAEVVDKIKPAAAESKDYDMIFYSSDVATDAQQVGALLAKWRRTDTIVFHMRDEAQSLAKAEDNDIVPSHKVDVPPPPLLQYLRYYLSNLYGLNLNITATHFPTLLEEDMWGFYGSTGQNVRTGFKVSESYQTIERSMGAKFLPRLTPAILPEVTAGYVGVAHLLTWKNKAGVDTVLQIGANHSALRNGETYDFDTQLDDEDIDAAGEINAAAAKKSKQFLSLQQIKNKKYAVGDDVQLTEEEEKDKLAQELEEAQKDIKDILAANDLDGNGVHNPDADSDEDEQEVEDAAVEAAAVASAKKKGKKVKKKAKKTAAEKKAEAEAKQARVDADTASVTEHWEEWHGSPYSAMRDLNQIKGIEDTEGAAGLMLVPTYLGALNADISDTGMVSFVRHFSKVAHATAVRSGAFGDWVPPEYAKASGNVKAGTNKFKSVSDPTPAQDQQFGCTFILFTTAISNLKEVKDSKVNTAQQRLDKRYTNPSAPSKGGKKAAQAVTPCDGVSGVKNVTSALVCTYLPSLAGNKGLVPGSEPELDIFLASTADVAINWALQYRHKNVATGAPAPVTKVAILGYGMLQAGLTVQVFAQHPISKRTLVYCPQWLALATSADAALDAQLQIAGRAFVELKNQVAPTPAQWPIYYLGVGGAVQRLNDYSAMEEKLARVKGLRMFMALKDPLVFGKDFMSSQSGDNKLGVVGVRRGDFAQILGLTAKTANERLKDATARKVAAAAGKAPPPAPPEPAPPGGGAGPSGVPPGGSNDPMEGDE